MAGHGRGLRTLTFSVDSLGLSRDFLAPTVQQPTPVFPVVEQKPLPLAGGEEAEYLLALKQDLRAAMKMLPFFIQPTTALRDVERYSDKYHTSEQTDAVMDWSPDWRRFPRELQVHVRKMPRGAGGSCLRSGGGQPSQLKKKKKKVAEKEEVLLKLESLEKKEQQSSEEEGEEKQQQQQQEDEEVEEEYDEEFEEETDYIMSYFDNGEDFGGDSDDNLDEAIY